MPLSPPSSNAQLSRTAHAKLNLGLHVLGLRADGYHALQSLVVFAGCGDELELTPLTGAGLSDQVQLSGPFAHCLDGGNDNIVLAAARAFRKRWPGTLPSAFLIKLTKNLPVAAGIGGGSADAAALLNMMSDMANVQINKVELLALANELGADVPVCLSTRPAFMAGKGEEIMHLNGFPQLYAVLVNPGKAVSTASIFAILENKENLVFPSMPTSFSSIDDLVSWLGETRNDLFAPAVKLAPQIEAITCFLKDNSHCLFARMSGSGATVFGLFETLEQAEQNALAVSQKWPDYWVTATPVLTR